MIKIVQSRLVGCVGNNGVIDTDKRQLRKLKQPVPPNIVFDSNRVCFNFNWLSCQIQEVHCNIDGSVTIIAGHVELSARMWRELEIRIEPEDSRAWRKSRAWYAKLSDQLGQMPRVLSRE